MRLVLSGAIAYLMFGISQVLGDLSGRSSMTGTWVHHPTLGRAILIAAMWPSRPMYEISLATTQRAREIAFGLARLLSQMIVMTAFVWLSVTGAVHLFSNPVLQVLGTAVFVAVIGLPLMPLVEVVAVVVMMILAWPLDLLFPLKED